MSEIHIDRAKYIQTHRDETKSPFPGLWTFSIQEKNVCFWGKYPDAEVTAKEYAHIHGIDAGTITLVDCTGQLRGTTRH